jgi:transmembrane sensor
MTDELNWRLLDRFLAGECGPAERAAVLQWLERHPLAAQYLEVVRRALAKHDARPSPRRWPGAGSHGFRIAAVLALVAGAAALWRLESLRHEPAMREFTTARGRRAAIRFADGTRIVLSVDSKLRVPADYGVTARAVYLDGEAYFAIAHDPGKPFAVHAGQSVVWDLGTRFGVRAYADEPDVEVVVADGKVRLRAAGAFDSPGQVVSGGELSRLDHTGVASLPRRVDTRRYLAWTAGRLAFEDAPLGVVLPQLARWYDVDFTLGAPSLADRHLTLSVRGEPVAQVLDAIALLAHARYERVGQRVTFYPTN